ncbi:hypothetical protein PVAP13_2KG541130 [Panicum virgatum]|uniref:Uncharacterized protein n=1 Tax=Panicum virgatum TaxID=38727 RepID=A0A8T0WGC7_PANVG|nr:hypothetical protein PVAP13_2KG541130 [Panicum virgatum]
MRHTRVGPSHTPLACRRPAHRIRQLPIPSSPIPRPRPSEEIDHLPWDPPYPFFFSFPAPLSLLSSRVVESNKQTAEQSRLSNPAASYRIVSAYPDLCSIRG